MAAIRWPPRHKTRHIVGQPRHIKAPVLHPHVDIVRPGLRIFLTLFKGQYVPRVRSRVINRLILPQQFNRPINSLRADSRSANKSFEDNTVN